MLRVLGLCICLAVSLPAQERTAGRSDRQTALPGLPAPLLKIYEDFAKTREAAAGRMIEVAHPARPAGRVQQANADPAPDPAYPFLLIAYDSLREEDFDTAIQNFLKGIAASPNRTDIRKDCAYTYYKVGQNENARQQFLKVMQLDPTDYHSALEVAFLDYESTDPSIRAESRRIFLEVSRVGDPDSKAMALAAFQSIEASLISYMNQWKDAVRLEPYNPVSHYRLAQLAEEHGDLDLAIENYRGALPVRTGQMYVDLARVLLAAGRTQEAKDALISATKESDAFAAEVARDRLADTGVRVP